MPEESEAGTQQQPQQQQQQGSPELTPLLVSVAAAAVAGAVTVLARKALSGAGGGSGGSGASGSKESGGGDRPTAFEDLDKVADDLDALVQKFRAESPNRDFQRLTEIVDTLSEYADQAADAFSSASGDGDSDDGGSDRRVTDELMGRIRELTDESRQSSPSEQGAAA